MPRSPGTGHSLRQLSYSANAVVAEGTVLGHVQHQRCAAFQRTSVGFVARSVVEENAVAGADGGLTISVRIERKSDSWRWIEQMSRHATVGHSVDAAPHQAVGNARIEVRRIQWNRSA